MTHPADPPQAASKGRRRGRSILCNRRYPARRPSSLLLTNHETYSFQPRGWPGGAGAPAHAEYPDRPLRLIVPFPPGQATDIFARALAEKLGAAVKQPVVVENRPEPAAISAWSRRRARRPTATLVIAGSAAAVNQTLYKTVNYKLPDDFAPVSGVFSVPLMFLATPASGIHSLKQLVEQARAKPGDLAYASAGIGGTQHLSAEMFKAAAQIDIRHIPYGQRPGAGGFPGAPGAADGGLGDRRPATCAEQEGGGAGGDDGQAAAAATRRADGGRVRLSGFRGDRLGGGAGARGTPPEVTNYLSQQIGRVLGTPEMQKFFRDRGAEPMPMTPEATGSFISGEVKKWGEAVKQSGAQVD